MTFVAVAFSVCVAPLSRIWARGVLSEIDRKEDNKDVNIFYKLSYCLTV